MTLKNCVKVTYNKSDYFRDSSKVHVVVEVQRYTSCLNFLVFFISKHLPLFVVCMDGKIVAHDVLTR